MPSCVVLLLGMHMRCVRIAALLESTLRLYCCRAVGGALEELLLHCREHPLGIIHTPPGSLLGIIHTPPWYYSYTPLVLS